MYAVGLVQLGLGITILFLCGIPLIFAEPVIEGVICTVCVPVPMIVVGIALIRRVEDQKALGNGAIADVPKAGAEDRSDPIRGAVPRTRFLDPVLDFDLNRLNWVGWLLLLGTFGFVGAEAVALTWVIEPGTDPRLLKMFVAPPMVLLAVGFFVGLKWLLGVFGVSIYRRAVHRGNLAACPGPQVAL